MDTGKIRTIPDLFGRLIHEISGSPSGRLLVGGRAPLNPNDELFMILFVLNMEFIFGGSIILLR